MPDCLFSDSSTSWDLDGVTNYEGLLAMTAFARRQRFLVNDGNQRLHVKCEMRTGRGLFRRRVACAHVGGGTIVGWGCAMPTQQSRRQETKGIRGRRTPGQKQCGIVESRLTPVRLLPDSNHSPLSVSCARRSERPMPPRRQLSSHPGSTSEISLFVAGTSIRRTGWNAKIVTGP